MNLCTKCLTPESTALTVAIEIGVVKCGETLYLFVIYYYSCSHLWKKKVQNVIWNQNDVMISIVGTIEKHWVHTSSFDFTDDSNICDS